MVVMLSSMFEALCYSSPGKQIKASVSDFSVVTVFFIFRNSIWFSFIFILLFSTWRNVILILSFSSLNMISLPGGVAEHQAMNQEVRYDSQVGHIPRL